MPIARLSPSRVRRRAASGISSAPLMFMSAALSIAITLSIAIGTLAEGRMPRSAPFGLICAVVLAACAAAEASKPARSERVRRRATRNPRRDDTYARDPAGR